MCVTIINQELAYAATQMRGRRFVFTHQMATLLCMKFDVMAVTLKVSRQIENPVWSTDVYLRTEHSCHSFDPIRSI